MSAGMKQVASKPSMEGSEEKMKSILLRTGYSLDVTPGQRKYGGPPPGWEGPKPGPGCEVSLSLLNLITGGLLTMSQVWCGNIPNNIYEDELIPHFEKCGRIWELRLMMNPLTGLKRLDLSSKLTVMTVCNLLFSLQKLRLHHIHQQS